jgi:hypothetical protein
VFFGDPGNRCVRKQQTVIVEKKRDKLYYCANINQIYVNSCEEYEDKE